MGIEMLRLECEHREAFEDRHPIAKPRSVSEDVKADFERAAIPAPRILQEIVSSLMIPNRSMRFRRVARVMPRSFAART